MNQDFARKIILLLIENLQKEEVERGLIGQYNNVRFENTDHKPGNFYWELSVSGIGEKVLPVATRIESLFFWERTQNIPIDCIIRLQDGYMKSLEVYSADGAVFDHLCLDNIEIVEDDGWNHHCCCYVSGAY